MIADSFSWRFPIPLWLPDYAPSDPFGRALGSAVLSSLLEHPSMNIISHPQTVSASPRLETKTRTEAVLKAAEQVTSLLEHGKVVTAGDLRQIMTAIFGGSDAEGLWLWKDAYEATEIAQVLFLRKFRAVVSRTQSPQSTLAMVTRLARLLPTHTCRSEESQALQQFSTPIPLAYVASRAARITAADVILEPSTGTGLMAIFAELAGARLALNEYAAARHALLEQLFPVPISQHDAAHIDDYLGRSVRPTVVLMNPPFSAGVHVEGRVADAAWRHLTSAFARLLPGGRLVAITGASLSPDNPAWRDAFVRLQGQGTVLFTTPVDGSVYARHGATMETRLIVIDKIPAGDPSKLSASSGTDLGTLLTWITGLPPRQPSTAPNSIGALANGMLRADTMRPAAVAAPSHRHAVAAQAKPAPMARPECVDEEVIKLSYELRDAQPKDETDASYGIYETYRLQSIHIPGGMTLRRVRVMNDYRVELIGFTDGMRDWLRSIGLFSEMINWKLRLFVPVTDEGAAILSKLIERHRLVDVARRS